MKHHPRKALSDFDIELDGYESTMSSEDFEEDVVNRYRNDGNGATGEPFLDRINIKTAHATESNLPDVPNTEDPFKNTELVLKFNPKIQPKALRWFIQRIIEKRERGGAGLLLKREPFKETQDEGLVVHVTATSWRLLEVAEKLEIQKIDYIRETIRPFQLLEVTNFLEGSMDISDILSPAEKQMVVAHELKNIVGRPGEKHVPGYEHIRLSIGQSIFHVFTTKQLIISYFALHQQEELKELDGKWFMEFWDKSPYEDIRSYFGDSTCLYFNFLAYFSLWLTIPAVIGLFMRWLPDSLFHHLIFLFCIINMLFVTIFQISWQRYQSRITYEWGTLQGISRVWEPPRDNYVGIQSIDPVTGHVFRRFPYSIVAFRTYVVSIPIVIFSCLGVIYCMFKYLEWEVIAKRYAATKMRESGKWHSFWFLLPHVPVSVYCVVIYLFTKIYRRVAAMLTEWENHRTETQFERHLVIKMVIFEVVNCFGIFFYTAFMLNDPIILQNRLFFQILIVQTLFILEQVFWPIIYRATSAKVRNILNAHTTKSSKISTSSVNSGVSVTGVDYAQQTESIPGLEGFEIDVLDARDYRVQMSEVEEQMVPYKYEEDFDEYLNLFLQFGYTFLFSSVYPVAAVFSLVSNLVLLSTSLFKRREVYQRALARRVNGIGAWSQAFHLLGIFSVISNCALLGINKPLRATFPGYSDFQWMVMFVLIEHAIIGVQFAVWKVCPKVPYAVKMSLAKLEFRSRMAYKREAMDKARRRRVGQVFDPINHHLYGRPQSTPTEDTVTEIMSKVKENHSPSQSQEEEPKVKSSPGSLKLPTNEKNDKSKARGDNKAPLKVRKKHD